MKARCKIVLFQVIAYFLTTGKREKFWIYYGNGKISCLFLARQGLLHLWIENFHFLKKKECEVLCTFSFCTHLRRVWCKCPRLHDNRFADKNAKIEIFSGTVSKKVRIKVTVCLSIRKNMKLHKARTGSELSQGTLQW